MRKFKAKLGVGVFVSLLVLVAFGLIWQRAHPIAIAAAKPLQQPQPASTPKAAPLNRADFVKGAEAVCEQFTEANNALEVRQATENAFEVPVKHPVEDKVMQVAHIGVTYRAGSDGILMRADCKVAKVLDGGYLMEHWSAAAE